LLPWSGIITHLFTNETILMAIENTRIVLAIRPTGETVPIEDPTVVEDES